MKRIALLGGTGFAGRNVFETLGKAGIECVSASRAEGVDLRDPAATREFVERCQPDFIVNCAAHVGSLNYVTEHAASIITDNTLMMLAIYRAVAEVAPSAIVINPIANCAYPSTATTFEEDHWWDGHLHRSVLSYGSTRRMLWSIGECFQMQHGVRSISLLVPNMYGPHDSTDPNKAHALNALISKAVRLEARGGGELEVWGTGVAVREWLYVGDFAKIVSLIIEDPDRPGLSEPINIGQNFGLSVRELVGVIKRQINFKGNIIWNDRMPDGAPRKVMDDRRFRRVFPRFEFTELETGIEATIRNYRSRLPY